MPEGNWGAERELNRGGDPGGETSGMQGAASGAGDGGFGPEGGFGGAGGERQAEVLGQVNGNRDPLADEAKTMGHVDGGDIGAGRRHVRPDASEGESGRRT